MFKVVVATPDVAGERMAGPGIRAWHLAQEIGKHFPTTLVAQIEVDDARSRRPEEAGMPVLDVHSREARDVIRDAAALIGQPARGFRRMREGQRIVFDLFDPVLLELREMYGSHPSLRQRLHYVAERMRIERAIDNGDLLICATPQQRELYERGRDRLIEIPFGVEREDDAGRSPLTIGREVPLRSASDSQRSSTTGQPLIVWGGGTWEWLDPKTAVEAVVRLNRKGLPCRLLFLGRTRPNRALVDRRRENRFDMLIAAGTPWVSANDEWVPYRERLSWLRRAKIAMMLHRSTAEARYSIRTRLFDAIATATPVIATEEGFAAELVADEGLGLVVPPSDVAAVAAAIERLLRDDVFHAQCVSNLERIRPRFAWPAVVRPLIEALNRWKQDAH
ncbi:MAG TPA: glycosyltransferase [Thermoanaerobaculia bacterium]|nr:glycosyltransferase [Thermoanaerobaculia bacterium]